MKRIKFGERWTGDSHADMINKVLGTSYKAYMKATVSLSKFGIAGDAWFIFMDGKPRGVPGMKYTNTLSADEKTITEKCFSDDPTVAAEIYKSRLIPLRLAFQLDPNETGNRYECKFVGYFKLVNFDKIALVKVFEKIADEAVLH